MYINLLFDYNIHSNDISVKYKNSTLSILYIDFRVFFIKYCYLLMNTFFILIMLNTLFVLKLFTIIHYIAFIEHFKVDLWQN